MKNMFVRGVSGSIYVAVVLACCFTGIYGHLFLSCFLGAAAILEWQQFDKEARSTRAAVLSIGVLFLLNYAFSTGFEISEGSVNNLVFIAVFLFTILLISQAFTRKGNIVKPLFHNTFGLVYVGLPMFLLPFIPNYKGQNEPWILASIFILIWNSDTFAYLVGRQFGKRKLLERISPNKTIEGFLGGLLFTYLAGFVLYYFVGILSLYGWLGLSTIVVVFGTTGDLVESALKRNFNLKDSGNFLPGHGGILDRIDSLLMTVPIAYFYLQILENL